MKNLCTPKGSLLSIAVIFLVFTFQQATAQTGKISQKVTALQQQGLFTSTSDLFIPVDINTNTKIKLQSSISNFQLFTLNNSVSVSTTRPAQLRFILPAVNGRAGMEILLYQQDISPNGFTLLTSDGKKYNTPNIVHYRGSVAGDPTAIAAFSFSANEVAGIIGTSNGNLVFGKLNDGSENHILYNDLDLLIKPAIECGTTTASTIPLPPNTYFKENNETASLTTKCVDWYWETDYDVFNNKGTVALVNTFIQGIFNQVSTLYANDGISITLQTLFVWTTTDPYTGPSTSNYLTQFGNNRTSFDGDLATLIGFQGSGGVAWVNGLCNNQNKYKMSYAGINTGYSTVPTYSWTVEVITHEQGHQLGSPHTHDCSWNGNNTKIDGCGDAAGYPSGSCAVPSPASPVGGGTIMSYCHLTSVGIKFNLGFGPQPTALMISKIENASCLSNCNSGCNVPAQPGIITGATTACAATTQTYSITAVGGATGYTWTFPSGWTGNSTTNSITVTTGSSSGTISVTAMNSCGNSTARTASVTINSTPAQPATIAGNAAVCSSTSQSYNVAAVSGATSYTWTLPSGWTGSSTSNNITATTGTGGGNITVKANNSCGSGTTRTLAVSITANGPAQPGVISGATTVCQTTTQTFSVTAISGVTGYNWTLPSGWSGTSTTNSITATVGAASGNISVAAINGCGTSAARTKAVTVSPVPARPLAITVSGGAAAACPGQSRTYTIAAVSGATSYTWTVPAGGSITSGQGTTSIAVSYNNNFVANGTVSVRSNNACGSSFARNFTVVLNKPASPASISGPTTACTNAVTSYTAAAVTGATAYAWTVPTGASIQGVATGRTISVLWGTRSGAIAVKAYNGCAYSGSRSLGVTVNCSAPFVKNNIPSIDMYPNPAVNVVNVRFNAATNSVQRISVTDMTGKIILSETVKTSIGENIHSLHLSNVAKGSYFVTIQNNEGKKVMKLQVQ